MSGIREMAVLAACERLIRRWPVEARIAFRDAVMQDVSQFAPEDWNVAAVQIRAEIFGERWRRKLPWPPLPDELARDPEPVLTLDRDAVESLARRICALGVELARATR